MSVNPGGPNDQKTDKPADAPQPGVSPNPPVSREGEAEPQSVGEGGAPATKDELATDLSEIARARLANTDKSIETESRAAHAADLARGVAGKDADDGTAAAVEAAPTAAVDQSHPGPTVRERQGADEAAVATPVPPTTSGGPPRTVSGGGSESVSTEAKPGGHGYADAPATSTTPPAEAARPGRPADNRATTSTPAAAAAEAVSAGSAAPPPGPAKPTVGAETVNPARRAVAGGVARPADAESDPTPAASTGAPAAPGTAGATNAAPTATPPAAPSGAGTAPAAGSTQPGLAGATTAPAAPTTHPAGGAPPRPAGAAAPATGAPAKPAGAARPAGAAGAAKPGAAKPGAAPAAPPKPAEPDPEDVVALREVVPDLTWERKHGYVEVKITREALLPTARKVLSMGYDYLSAVTAVDYRDRLEMLYHVYSFDYVEHPGCIVLKFDLPPEPNPLCPSLTSIWPGANFQEREIYDLMGVKFVGHPDLRRILLEDRFPGHPLRKDWTFDYEYVLVRHLRHGAEGQFAPPGGEEGFRRV